MSKNISNDSSRDFIEVLSNNVFFIFSSTFILTFIAVLYIIFLPNFFTSSSLLKVSVNDNGNSASGLSAYAGLASLAGVSMPTAGDDKGMIAIETIKSRSFLKRLISFEGVLENIVAAKYYDFDKEKIVYDESIYNQKTKTWVIEKPSYLEAYEYYEEFMSVSQNKATGFISLSYEHVSPQFSYELTSLIIKEINLLMKFKDMKESSDSLIYLQNILEETNNTNIKLQLNQMIENQLRTQMLSNIRDDYLLMAIDPPFIAEEKSSPRRAILCIIFLLINFILSISLLIIRESFALKSKKIIRGL
jgi:uncharacterized protein involved in exopolysaccharide biosynthesis